MRLLPIICLWAMLSMCYGYRILCVFPFEGKSHFVMYEQVMKALARKGHQVDVISAFPRDKSFPNYTDIVEIPVPISITNNLTFDMLISKMMSATLGYTIPTVAGNPLCHHLGHPVVQKLVHDPPKNPPYDLVIIEVRVSRNLSIDFLQFDLEVIYFSIQDSLRILLK